MMRKLVLSHHWNGRLTEGSLIKIFLRRCEVIGFEVPRRYDEYKHLDDFFLKYD